jgi:hypothetical protein
MHRARLTAGFYTRMNIDEFTIRYSFPRPLPGRILSEELERVHVLSLGSLALLANSWAGRISKGLDG